MNNQLAQHVLEIAIQKGIKEFCVCPGARNAPLVYALDQLKHLVTYYWFEERSAAFFALGRIKALGQPVAVLTTSGTAAGELLPAAMEAYYTGLPLLLMTADRPRRFRGTGAPQSAEQVGLFGCYAHFNQDLAGQETCDLDRWSCKGPAHLNICFEEPNEVECQLMHWHVIEEPREKEAVILESLGNEQAIFLEFMDRVQFPLAIVGALSESSREKVVQFLLRLNAPIYAEGLSGLREEPRLEHLRVACIDQIWQQSQQFNYPIDGILRVGGVPTARLWRDLEEKKVDIHVCCISEQPFSGLSRAAVICISLAPFLAVFQHQPDSIKCRAYPFEKWLEADHHSYQKLMDLFTEEPLAEPSLIHQLSKQLPSQALVYLGNSLPIREWDLAATYVNRNYQMQANRGLNGIDGQISTFLGLSVARKNAWALIGDLTLLYDMAGPWILSRLPEMQVNITIINNGGGQIFSRMFSLAHFTNAHDLHFEHLAAFWKMNYAYWERIPDHIEAINGNRLIEIVPDSQATLRFWKKRLALA